MPRFSSSSLGRPALRAGLWGALGLFGFACATAGGASAPPGGSGGEAPAGVQPGAEASGVAERRGDGAEGALSRLNREVRPLAPERVNTRFDVQYTKHTVVLDGRAAKALKLADEAAHTYRFNRAELGPEAARLVPGAVLLIPGKALRKITQAEERGGETLLHTEFAPLTEMIENGNISMKAKLDFSRAHVVAAIDDAGRAHPLPTSQALASPSLRGPAKQKGFIEAGTIPWSFERPPLTYHFEVTPEGDAVRIVIRAVKQTDKQATLAYTAEGVFGNVWVNLDGEISERNVKSLTYDQPDLNGDISLSIAAAGAGVGEIDFPFPGLLFEFIVMLGPIPVTVGITAKMIGNINVPASASATMKSRFNFRASTGFKYNGSDVDVQGNVGALQFSPESPDAAAMIGVPVDAQWGVAFPRVTVSIFDSLFVPFLHAGVVVGSALKWGPACKHGYVKYLSEAGYDFKIFGIALKSDKVEIVKREQRAPKEGCPQ